jgi:CRISPR-associated protein Cas2
VGQRRLYLAAYDISRPSRLVTVLKIVRGYATGGQKSVHEIFLSDAERVRLLMELEEVIDQDEDRFFLLRLDPRSVVETLGQAMEPGDPDFFYIG